MNAEEQVMSKDKISEDIVKVKWELLCLLSLKYFSQDVGIESWGYHLCIL